MSSGYISAELRREVALRAERLCEYCLIHENDTFYGCEIDHIISEKHGGPTRQENLAYACLVCNRYKGSDIATLAPETGQLIRLFSPRLDLWAEHFRLERDGITISPRTLIGGATVRLLGFNEIDRLAERSVLRQIGRFPTEAALRRMKLPPQLFTDRNPGSD